MDVNESNEAQSKPLGKGARGRSKRAIVVAPLTDMNDSSMMSESNEKERQSKAPHKKRAKKD